MITLYNENLSKHTTIKIGGIASVYYIPESVKELIYLIKTIEPQYYIGGGSNILISNQQYECVVDLRKINEEIIQINKGTFYVGASVRLQRLINTINDFGYGGIEYLFSVPGLVGGAVAMNAGRGKSFHQSISDYVIEVEVIKNGKLEILKAEDCAFDYRQSLFKKHNIIIIAVKFRFPNVDKVQTDMEKQKRLQYCKERQDNTGPNLGSIFTDCNPHIMSIVKHLGYKKGKSHFSKKTENWIISDSGSFEEVDTLINRIELIHKLLKRPCKREIIIWKK